MSVDRGRTGVSAGVSAPSMDTASSDTSASVSVLETLSSGRS